jgi:nucleotide-binding universal stress UspA family protein
MKAIIVPVNFSACARNAVLYAGDLARIMKADLHLVHVVGIPFSVSEVAMTDYVYEQMIQAANTSLKELQVDVIRHTHGKVWVEISIEVGNFGASMKQICEKLQPYVVVLGSSGPTLEKFLAGSPVASLLHHLQTPIIVVPEKATFRHYNRILLTCDPVDVESGLPQFLPLLKELRDHFGSRFDIITVETANKVGQPDKCNEHFKDLYPDIHLIHASRVEEGIQQYLGNHEVDLVLVFPKKHRFLDFHISQSRKLARHIPIPVMSLNSTNVS